MVEEFYDSTHFDYHEHTEHEFEELHENLQVILYSLVAFCVPFFLSHPQFLVGSLVNMMLILGAQNLRGYKLFVMIFTPSLGVVSAGIIFGGFTQYLLYFIPMIWVGNIILVYGYKYARHHFKLNQMNAVALSIVGKVLLLTLNAYLLVAFNVVPQMFLYAMSVMQFATAVLGAGGALLSTKFIVSKFSKTLD